MTTLKERIDTDLKNAMRARDTQTLSTLRLITAAIKQVEIDERIVVDDTRLLTILDKLAKQRKESIEQFKAASRDDLVKQEEFELGIITCYLPTPLTAAEVERYLDEAIAHVKPTAMKDMGQVMTYLKPQLQGRTDMAKVSQMIKQRLS
ncbi:MAG: glutamyl-tRNA amidotransferase [Legionellaceae bacterium]|nr:glutamyl-tRNA amidotransferase [Legionellaceae bacterium]HAF87920.1 glutamyl-tRNA amidotransferase [Legionellales bacterium]HCA89598.1 glutamyl-tRNA amidotransferase [Legionellales bacterium]|tara:strand:+ start:1154 stop:1600 length:447 start_codon:yes stop_codon:yes gene_type:complete